MNNTLVIIPARGGSKGLPKKNIKPLCGKPLICYTIDTARDIFPDSDICVSTDCTEIKTVVENYGLEVPFLRPDELSTDTASTDDVLRHALSYFENKGRNYKTILLLQPTSPLRTSDNIKEAFDIYFETKADMVVSVFQSHSSAVLAQDNKYGNLQLVFNKDGNRRQDSNKYYEYNGAIYIIDVEKLKQNKLHEITNRKKYIMTKQESIDIDDIYDFMLVEAVLKMTGDV